MTDCEVCGLPMLHYENPDRWLCPRAHEHAKYTSGQAVGTPRRPGRKREGREGRP